MATKLSNSSIEALPAPTTGQKFYWDAGLSGFGVRVTAAGAKSYIAQGRVDGKTRRFTIGPCHLLDYREARKRALDRLGEMHDGKDPQAERKKRQAKALTLRAVMLDYIDKKRTRNGPLRPTSQADIEKCVTKVFAEWADKPVASITREMCLKRFRELSARAPAQANQAFRNLRALLNWARVTNVAPDGSYPILPVNPVVQAFESTQWNAERPREERVPMQKLGQVWAMLTERADKTKYPSGDVTAAHLVQFLILTGARIGEACSLKWTQVRLEDEVPSFTFTQTKNHNVVTIPMSGVLHEILSARYEARPRGSEYVFPARAGTAVGHIKDARGTMEKVSEVAGMHLHNHDLRRTFVAIAIASGIELWKAELLTNHVAQSVTLNHYTETSDLRYLQGEVESIAQWIVSKVN